MGTDQVTSERGAVYGPFSWHAYITQGIKRAMRYASDGQDLTLHWEACEVEAADMIAHKISRVVNGSGPHYDSILDIGGYAKIGASFVSNPMNVTVIGKTPTCAREARDAIMGVVRARSSWANKPDEEQAFCEHTISKLFKMTCVGTNRFSMFESIRVSTDTYLEKHYGQ